MGYDMRCAAVVAIVSAACCGAAFALGFDGLDAISSSGGKRLCGDSVVLRDNPKFDLASGLSMSCRVKFDAADCNMRAGTSIASKGFIGHAGAFLLRADWPAGGGDGRLNMFVNFGKGPEPRATAPVPLKAGVWYDVAAGWDGTNSWVSVNGKKAVRRREDGRLVGSAAPLRIGAMHGEIADFRIDGRGMRPPEQVTLAPGLALSCDVVFPSIPTQTVNIVSKSGEYILRYDYENGGAGEFCFFVKLGGQWEPRLPLVMKVSAGKKYRLAAKWDGVQMVFSVDGSVVRRYRNGAESPTASPPTVGTPGLAEVTDFHARSDRRPLLSIESVRTYSMMPVSGDRLVVTGEVFNAGHAAKDCVLEVRGRGGKVTPSKMEIGEMGRDCRWPFSVVIDTDPVNSASVEFFLKVGGEDVCSNGRSFALMPREEPKRSAAEWSPPIARRRAYYVDSAAGDDARDGLAPETAWRSFANAANLVLGPGEALLLKRGSVFDEQLVVSARGSAENWAEIAAYGEGPRPQIRRRRHINDRCACIAEPSFLAVRDLVVCNAGKGIDVFCNAPDSGHVLVERCLAHHIEGLYRFNAHGIPEWWDCPGAKPGGSRGGGIAVEGAKVHDVVIRECEMYQCSEGFRANGDDVFLTRILCHDNYCHNTSPHPFLTSTKRAWLTDSVFDASSWHACAGTMGIMLGGNDALVIRNCHFLNQPDSGSPDEGGIDFENSGQNALVERCTFRNNAGASIEILGLVVDQTRNVRISGCRFDRNNTKLKLGPSEIFVWGSAKADRRILCSNGLVENNGYVLHDGVKFYANWAERTRKDWILTGNREFATSAELDAAYPYGDPPAIDIGDEIWTDLGESELAVRVKSDGGGKLKFAWEMLEGPAIASFSAPKSAATRVAFPAVGDYRVFATADNGQFWRTARTAVHVLPRGTKVAKAWTFSRNLDKEGWDAENLGTSIVSIKGTTPFWNATAFPVNLVCGDYWVMAVKDSSNAALVSPDSLGVAVSPGECNSFVIKFMNHTNSSKMRLFYATDESPEWSRDKSVAFDVKPNDEDDSTYVVKLPQLGTLRRVKLDLSADGSPVTGSCRIDYAYLGGLVDNSTGK